MEPKAKTGIVQILKVHLKRGITLRDLSRQAGLSPDSLRNVFTRSRRELNGLLRTRWASRRKRSGRRAMMICK